MGDIFCYGFSFELAAGIFRVISGFIRSRDWLCYKILLCKLISIYLHFRGCFLQNESLIFTGNNYIVFKCYSHSVPSFFTSVSALRISFAVSFLYPTNSVSSFKMSTTRRERLEIETLEVFYRFLEMTQS